MHLKLILQFSLNLKGQKYPIGFAASKFSSGSDPRYKEFRLEKGGLIFNLNTLTKYTKDLLIEKVSIIL